jgi:hypothetical protein
MVNTPNNLKGIGRNGTTLDNYMDILKDRNYT